MTNKVSKLLFIFRCIQEELSSLLRSRVFQSWISWMRSFVSLVAFVQLTCFSCSVSKPTFIFTLKHSWLCCLNNSAPISNGEVGIWGEGGSGRRKGNCWELIGLGGTLGNYEPQNTKLSKKKPNNMRNLIKNQHFLKAEVGIFADKKSYSQNG